jgi:acetyl esterase
MPIDPRVARFLNMLNAGSGKPTADVTVAERRAGLEQLMQLAGPKAEVAEVEDRMLPGAASALRVRVYTPIAPASELLPGIVYFHGGGFVAGTLATHDNIARELARAGKCRIVSVAYRLAPEHPFPAATDDARAAVAYVAAHAADFGIDASRLGVCGDSAGGTLAAATCQSFARAGGPPLALQLLLCPILDYSRSTDSRREFARGYLVDQATLDHDLRHYLATPTDTADPRISPLCAADLSGLPRTVIHTAEFDPLRDEGRLYFERLTRAGAAVSYTCHPGMIHLFYGLEAVIPYARTAYLQIGSDIRAALADAPPGVDQELL